MNGRNLSLKDRAKNAVNDFTQVLEWIYGLNNNVKKATQMLENMESKYENINEDKDYLTVYKSDLLTDIKITEDYILSMIDDINEMNRWAFGE